MQNYIENSSQSSQNDCRLSVRTKKPTEAVSNEEKREPLYAAGGPGNYSSHQEITARFIKNQNETGNLYNKSSWWPCNSVLWHLSKDLQDWSQTDLNVSACCITVHESQVIQLTFMSKTRGLGRGNAGYMPNGILFSKAEWNCLREAKGTNRRGKEWEKRGLGQKGVCSMYTVHWMRRYLWKPVLCARNVYQWHANSLSIAGHLVWHQVYWEFLPRKRGRRRGVKGD